ncbi:MAG: hypothetical protein HGA85_09305, partial [Nanoarchaeota archaeon]|nr:hypothetical protein [Nanoarchaeota archaeon]
AGGTGGDRAPWTPIPGITLWYSPLNAFPGELERYARGKIKDNGPWKQLALDLDTLAITDTKVVPKMRQLQYHVGMLVMEKCFGSNGHSVSTEQFMAEAGQKLGIRVYEG